MNYNNSMEACLKELRLAAYLTQNETVKEKIEALEQEIEAEYKKERNALYSMLCKYGEQGRVEKYRIKGGGTGREEDYFYNNGLYMVRIENEEIKYIWNGKDMS